MTQVAESDGNSESQYFSARMGGRVFRFRRIRFDEIRDLIAPEIVRRRAIELLEAVPYTNDGSEMLSRIDGVFREVERFKSQLDTEIYKHALAPQARALLLFAALFDSHSDEFPTVDRVAEFIRGMKGIDRAARSILIYHAGKTLAASD